MAHSICIVVALACFLLFVFVFISTFVYNKFNGSIIEEELVIYLHTLPWMLFVNQFTKNADYSQLIKNKPTLCIREFQSSCKLMKMSTLHQVLFQTFLMLCIRT